MLNLHIINDLFGNKHVSEMLQKCNKMNIFV